MPAELLEALDARLLPKPFDIETLRAAVTQAAARLDAGRADAE